MVLPKIYALNPNLVIHILSGCCNITFYLYFILNIFCVYSVLLCICSVLLCKLLNGHRVYLMLRYVDLAAISL